MTTHAQALAFTAAAKSLQSATRFAAVREGGEWVVVDNLTGEQVGPAYHRGSVGRATQEAYRRNLNALLNIH
jgi:hypothetical protein